MHDIAQCLSALELSGALVENMSFPAYQRAAEASGSLAWNGAGGPFLVPLVRVRSDGVRHVGGLFGPREEFNQRRRKQGRSGQPWPDFLETEDHLREVDYVCACTGSAQVGRSPTLSMPGEAWAPTRTHVLVVDGHPETPRFSGLSMEAPDRPGVPDCPGIYGTYFFIMHAFIKHHEAS